MGLVPETFQATPSSLQQGWAGTPEQSAKDLARVSGRTGHPVQEDPPAGSRRAEA